jgi:hypothetical protein
MSTHPLIQRLQAAQAFPTNTCAASRHTAELGAALLAGKVQDFVHHFDEAEHVAESLLATVAALWEARSALHLAREELASLRIHRTVNIALLAQLKQALDFMQGFEGDELQPGIDKLLANMRAAIAVAGG